VSLRADPLRGPAAGAACCDRICGVLLALFCCEAAAAGLAHPIKKPVMMAMSFRTGVPFRGATASPIVGFAVAALWVGCLEATPGIEPGYTVLQF